MPTRAVQAVMRPEHLVVTDVGTSVRDVVHLMAEHEANAVLVTREGILAGIFTEHDATFSVLAADVNADRTPVSEVMSRDPVTIAPDHPFGHALHLMFEGGFRHVPVVDEDLRPIGLVTSTDALNLEAREFGAELERREEITVIL